MLLESATESHDLFVDIVIDDDFTLGTKDQYHLCATTNTPVKTPGSLAAWQASLIHCRVCFSLWS